MDAIVAAGWRLSFGDRLIRRYGVAAAAALGAVAAVLVALFASGMPFIAAAAAGLAPAFVFVWLAAAFRAMVLDLSGDTRRAPDPLNLLRRSMVRAPEVLAVTVRALRQPQRRTPLTAPIVVVNGVDAMAAEGASRALVAHRWGEGTVITSGLCCAGLLVLPVALIDALVAVTWPYLGYARLPALAVAIGVTVAGMVVALALDASIRGTLLRVARGDQRALRPDDVALVMQGTRGRGNRGRAASTAQALLVALVVAALLMTRNEHSVVAAMSLGVLALGAVVMLTRAYRPRPGSRPPMVA